MKVFVLVEDKDGDICQVALDNEKSMKVLAFVHQCFDFGEIPIMDRIKNMYIEIKGVEK